MREQKNKAEMVGDRNIEILEKLKQRELVKTECLIIKMCFRFRFKTDGVYDHLKFIWKTVPLCWTGERKGTFAKFCTQSRWPVNVVWMVFRQWMRLVLGRAARQPCVPLHRLVLLWCHMYNCRQQQQLLTCRGWRLRTTAVLSRHITSVLTSGHQQLSMAMC